MGGREEAESRDTEKQGRRQIDGERMEDYNIESKSKSKAD